MKLRIAAFIALMLTISFALTLGRTTPVSGFQSPLALPAFTSPLQTPTASTGFVFQSPLSTPNLRTQYVGKELVATQEAEYVIQVTATRRAAIAKTLMLMDPSTPTPTPVLSPSATAVPAATP